MDRDPLFVAAMIAALIVLGVLLVGVAGFAKGGAFNKKYANKIMRLRVILQFVAVLLILAFATLSRGS